MSHRPSRVSRRLFDNTPNPTQNLLDMCGIKKDDINICMELLKDKPTTDVLYQLCLHGTYCHLYIKNYNLI